MKRVKDFLGKPAPAGYVAGAGRSGFTTRPDAIGDVSFEVAEEEDAGLLISRSMDPEDIEADLAFSKVDQTMLSRRKKKIVKSEVKVGAASSIFIDLKDSLKTISADEWAAIPEAGDRRTKKKAREEKKKNQPYGRFTPLPDELIMRSSGYTGSISGAAGEEEEEIYVKERMLGCSLDNLSSVADKDLNANDYLYKLSQQVINEDSLERARILIKSMLKGNPDNPSTWTAAIRLEIQAGRIKTGRSIARQAVNRLSQFPELWLELAQIAEDRRAVLMEALKFAKGMDWEGVWVAAVDCEQTFPGKQVLLKRALSSLPRSVTLWERLMFVCSATDQMSLLSRACEACPQAAQFWIRLSELETADNALSVLNTAIKRNPSCLDLWICLLRHSKADNRQIVEKAIEECHLTVDSSFPDCPEALMIVKQLIEGGDQKLLCNHPNEMVRRCALQSSLAHITLEECREVVKRDKELCLAALQLHPNDPALWMQHLEGHPEDIEQALKILPNDLQIWSLYLDQHPEDLEIAKQAYQSVVSGDIALHYIQLLSRRNMEHEAVLSEAIAKHPQHEGLLLMYAGCDEARLKEALQKCPTGLHLWIRACQQSSKSPSIFRAVWERANKAIPNSELLWYVHLCSAWHPSAAANAAKACPKSGLILSYIAAKEQNRALRKTRALDALARLPGDPWVLLLVGRLLFEECRDVESREHVKRALACAGQYADIYAQCIVLCPELEADAIALYKRNKPTISARFPDQLKFDIYELIESFRQ